MLSFIWNIQIRQIYIDKSTACDRAEGYGEWLLMRSFWSDKNIPKFSCVDGDIIVSMLKFTEFHS